MLLSKRIVSAISIFACMGSATFAADADRLSPERMAWIEAAYDQVLADPAHDTDRLSPETLAMIHTAFDTWNAQDVDRLSPGVWAAMKEAYRSHDPARVQFAGVLAQ